MGDPDMLSLFRKGSFDLFNRFHQLYADRSRLTKITYSSFWILLLMKLPTPPLKLPNPPFPGR